MRVSAVGRCLPEHYYSQSELTAAVQGIWSRSPRHLERIASLHQNVAVEGRFFTLPLDELVRLSSFTRANDLFIEHATNLGERAMLDALDGAGLQPSDVDHLFFVTTTGVATPSIDALLMNRLDLRTDLRRSPLFGLGCLAGAAGVARAADYLRGRPDHVACVLSVELCSLTAQWDDDSIKNVIASGLFGDGAAAVVLVGSDRVREGLGESRATPAGLEVVASRSAFYRHSEHVMGWEVGEHGFRLVLSADVPDVVHEHLAKDVTAFLAGHGLSQRDVRTWVCHPGGPKVLAAIQSALSLDEDALALTWNSLRTVGNLSSASVLYVLGDTMAAPRPPAGSYGLMVAMGPGFCAELVLLRW